MSESELGAFLRSRRAVVRPEHVGLPPAGRRRVAGLRREELASLAGMSVSYYTRIEQGGGGQASPSVLDAIARVLGLDEDERAHLHRLAGPPPLAPGEPERVRPGLAGLVHAMGVPAAVLGRSSDVLVWNRICHAIFAGHLPFRHHDGVPVNWTRVVFLDPHTRTLFADWPGTALDMVGRLRAAAARRPRDGNLSALVAELRAASPEFDRMWRRHPVQEGARGVAALRHPRFGELLLFDEVLRTAADPDQLVVTFHAEPGSPTHEVLQRLAAELGAVPVRTDEPPEVVAPAPAGSGWRRGRRRFPAPSGGGPQHPRADRP